MLVGEKHNTPSVLRGSGGISPHLFISSKLPVELPSDTTAANRISFSILSIVVKKAKDTTALLLRLA
jgi:hypothetical protein